MDTIAKALNEDNRNQPRYPIPSGLDAWIEVTLNKRCWCLPIVDLSEDGMSFECVRGMPAMELGASMGRVVVHVGDHEVRGGVTVRYVANSISAGTYFGGVFQPAGEKDREILFDLVPIRKLGKESGDAHRPTGTVHRLPVNEHRRRIVVRTFKEQVLGTHVAACKRGGRR